MMMVVSMFVLENPCLMSIWATLYMHKNVTNYS